MESQRPGPDTGDFELAMEAHPPANSAGRDDPEATQGPEKCDEPAGGVGAVGNGDGAGFDGLLHEESVPYDGS